MFILADEIGARLKKPIRNSCDFPEISNVLENIEKIVLN